MKHTWKKAAAFTLALALVAGVAPANVGTGGLFGGSAIVAYAAEYNSGENVARSDVQVGDILYADSTIQQNGGQAWDAPIYIDDGLAGYAGAYGGKYTVPCDTKVVAGGTSITLETLPSVTTDLSNATINVDVNNKSISVNADGRSISSTRYTVKYGATEENATSEFPTEPGSYYAFITANTDTYSNYVGSAKSAAFAITATKTVTWTDISANKSQDGISITSSGVDFMDDYIEGNNGSITFTSTAGKIKKIEISCNGQGEMDVFEPSPGWNECYGDGPLVWNGTAADSVTLSADIIDIEEFAQIVYTLEAKSDISDTTVTVDTDNQSVSVTRGNAFIPEDDYEVTYGATAETASADFPTAPGKYYAFVTAKTDSENYTGTATSEQFVVNGTLDDGQFKQTAQSGDKHYTRFVFIVPKSEFVGKSKAKFTAHYDGSDFISETSTCYSGVISNGILYTPASEDSAVFVVTVSSGSDISANLTCDIAFE